MTVKVQCPCGAKYSFEVEPVEGRMPYTVSCPVCQADGTGLANQIIAANAAQTPKLSIHKEAPPPDEEAPRVRPPDPAMHARAMERLASERRRWRLLGWLATAAVLLVLGLIGAWGWYTFVGSHPQREYTRKLSGPDDWRTTFFAPGKILMVDASRAILHDLPGGRDLWSTSLAEKGDETDAGETPKLFIDKNNIWICLGTRVLRLDAGSGAIQQTIPIAGAFVSFTPGQTNILVVSAPDETTRNVLQIDRASGETASQQIVVPRSEKHQMSNDLPPNVQPTAGVLLAQATDEHKFNKPLDAVSSEFFSAGVNLVELRVTLVEPKVTWVQAIQPAGPSHLNGDTTASTSAGLVAQDLFNDIKRSQTGGVKSVDESTYHVRLRRWLGPKPVEWQGDVTGVPMFFSLQTVDLVVAGKTLTVFDKQNNELFAAKLTFSLGEQFNPETWDHEAVPAVEANSTLYFFDAGVLTAFSLPGGDVRWRLTSIGIHRLQFDDHGNLYVDTTTASPEDIQYTEQINLEGAQPVLMKIAADSGRILWQIAKQGQECFLSGKYLYADSKNVGGAALALGMAEAINAPRQEGPSYFHVYRIDPADGRVLWDFYREEMPDEVSFSQNRFLVRLDDKVEAFKFLDF